MPDVELMLIISVCDLSILNLFKNISRSRHAACLWDKMSHIWSSCPHLAPPLASVVNLCNWINLSTRLSLHLAIDMITVWYKNCVSIVTNITFKKKEKWFFTVNKGWSISSVAMVTCRLILYRTNHKACLQKLHMKTVYLVMLVFFVLSRHL